MEKKGLSELLENIYTLFRERVVINLRPQDSFKNLKRLPLGNDNGMRGASWGISVL